MCCKRIYIYKIWNKLKNSQKMIFFCILCLLFLLFYHYLIRWITMVLARKWIYFSY